MTPPGGTKPRRSPFLEGGAELSLCKQINESMMMGGSPSTSTSWPFKRDKQVHYTEALANRSNRATGRPNITPDRFDGKTWKDYRRHFEACKVKWHSTESVWMLQP